MKLFLQIFILLVGIAPTLSKAQCNAIILANDSTICNGDSTTLNAIVVISCSPWTFQWSSGETTASINAKPTTTTTYILTSTDSGHVSQMDTFTVYVANCNTGCGITAAANKSALCLGDSTNIRAMNPVGCVQPLTYTWMPGGATTQDIKVIPSTTTMYTLTATDGTNTYIDSTNIIVVNCGTSCSVTITSPDTAICKGNSALLNASLILTCPNLTLTWTPGNISGSNALVSPTVTTTYTLTGFDGVRTFTDTFKVTVNECSGIKENTGITDFTSIVNSTEEKLTLSVKAPDIKFIETRLMNITGQVFETTRLQKNSGGIYTQTYFTLGLSPGVYIVSVYTDKGMLSQKVILQ